MKTLIAIAGCHARRDQADAQRQTWVRDVAGADVRFFAGGEGRHRRPDEVWLDCSDGYWERKEKIHAMIRWAFSQGYEYVWKVDDDVYLRPERLAALSPHDYCGCAVDHLMARACIGWLYGLSRRSMKLLLTARGAGSIHEDVWVGLRLREAGILPVQLAGQDGMIRCTHTHGVPNGWPNQEPPTPQNEVIASCEYTPEQMREVHSPFCKEVERWPTLLNS